MSLPDLPIINFELKRPFLCPVCAKKIATSVVSTRFLCPHCEMALDSNTGQASNRGFFVGVFSFLIIAIISYELSNQDSLISLMIQIFGGIAAYAAGYITYRKSVVIKKRCE